MKPITKPSPKRTVTLIARPKTKGKSESTTFYDTTPSELMRTIKRLISAEQSSSTPTTETGH